MLFLIGYDNATTFLDDLQSSKYHLTSKCFIWDFEMPRIHYKTVLPTLVKITISCNIGEGFKPYKSYYLKKKYSANVLTS